MFLNEKYYCLVVPSFDGRKRTPWRCLIQMLSDIQTRPSVIFKIDYEYKTDEA